MRRVHAFGVVVFMLLWGVCPSARAAEISGVKIEITQKIPGSERAALMDAFNQHSRVVDLVEEEDRPEESGLQKFDLERAARGDIRRFQRILRAYGYYDGKVTYEATNGESIKPVLKVTPGPQYLIALVSAKDTEGNSLELPWRGKPDKPRLRVGDAAVAEAILNAAEALITALRREGYPRIAISEQDVVVDHATRTLDVRWIVDKGPLGHFGTVEIEGLETVEQELVRRILPKIEGETFDPMLIEKVHERLAQTGLFSLVRVDVSTDGPVTEMPVDIQLNEADHRTIRARADYATSEGVRLSSGWTHRNLLGRGEILDVEASVGRLGQNAVKEIEYGLSTSFTKPHFRRYNQDLVTEISWAEEETDVYSKRGLALQASLQRRPTGRLSQLAGIRFEEADVGPVDGPQKPTRLIGAPLSLFYDPIGLDLDPQSGMRIAAKVTPWMSLRGDGNFLTLDGTWRGYMPVAIFGVDEYENNRVVAAFRLRLASQLATRFDDIPIDKRFFAGGGGSVRGYDYQSLCPRNDQGQRLGGQSLIEASAELRLRVAENWGVVPFIDFGGAFDRMFPSFDDSYGLGAGMGARFFTSFGVLRLDIATPLKRRHSDGLLGIYASIGQAF